MLKQGKGLQRRPFEGGPLLSGSGAGVYILAPGAYICERFTGVVVKLMDLHLE